MKLDAWLKQDRPLDERLRVIERLCQAVNEIHDRGDSVGGLEPGRVEVGDDTVCDLSAARKGKPRPPYARANEAGSPSQADIYAAGAIAWEVLAGRPAGKAPPHLSKVRPGLQRELADAIMACLEESPDWRPSDLTYLAQMAAVRQRATVAGTPRASRAPLPPRLTPTPARRRGPSRRTWPLLLALVVVVGLAALAGRQYLGGNAATPGAGSEGRAGRPAPAPRASAAPAPAPPENRTTNAPRAGAVASPADAPESTPPLRPEPVASEPEPEPLAPAVAPAAARGNAPVETAPPLPVSVPDSAPSTPLEPVTRPPAPAPPVADVPEPAAAQAPPAVPAALAVLSTVAPPTVKRPGKVLVDLRGTGLRADHRARILPVKKVPRGMKVVRQKHVDGTLITILLELAESAEPGQYAIAVEDGQGNRSAPLTFEVTE